MSRLTELLAQAKAKDPQMGEDLEREFKALSSRRAFGLNFERHRPETVELPARVVRKGDKVRVLPERGSTEKGDQRLWRVKKTTGKAGAKMAHLELVGAEEPEMQEVLLDDLVVVAEFRDYIYPGLVSTGKVERGGDKANHTVINGENYHVLKALTYTHRGKVDAIYIDPPYNTGAKDWKYNNDYVEGEDLYRHSKWLAFMERRLLIAKALLNPVDSVLIITIDEKEYLRLGLLLEQVFPEGNIQMISSVISPKGSARRGEFSRCDEYIYFVFFGDASVVAWADDMLHVKEKKTQPVRWKALLRSADNGRRQARPNLFYPLFFQVSSGEFYSAGKNLELAVPRTSVAVPKDCFAVWPIGDDGRELTWSLGRDTFLANLEEGFVRFGPVKNSAQRTPYYLMTGQIDDISTGELVVVGHDADGAVKLEHAAGGKRKQPMTIWARTSHSATEHGTGLIKKLLPSRKFPFPKSLYAVEDAIRFVAKDKNRAVVMDFFAGSGTTAHAVMRLNKQDEGRRQCISVTNNEVSADEQGELRKQELRPGDTEWEKLGICDYITKPRIEAAITGLTPDGELIKGDYKFTDEFPIEDGFEENAEFFTLTYESPVAISHNLAFSRIAPLLWMRAGSEGRRIEAIPVDGWEIADTYGLLTDLDRTADFCKAVAAKSGLRIGYIVTNDDRRFQAVARRLPDSVEPVRLYESYLSNFQFLNGK